MIVDAASASSSAAAAAASATTAEGHADDAEASATTASGHATTAEGHATTASGHATTAEGHKDDAETAKTAAESARDAALAAFDDFDDRYYGAHASDSAAETYVTGNGLTVDAGDLYFNTTDTVMKLYTGSAWVAAYVSGGSFLAAANNLSDVADAATARTNLGLGTAATSASTDFVAVTGDSMTGDLNFGDNDKAIFGTGSDLQIYHDGTNSQIRDLGTGDLYIQASAAVSFTNTNASETYAVLNENGAVSLYYDNSAKFATASAGVAVTGRATGTLTTDNDLSFDMNASNYFKCTPTGTGTLTFTNITAGQSGNIWLDNSGGHTISAAATTYIASADLTTISTAGVYFLSYYSDGTNVMVSATPAVTSAGA